MNTSTKSKLRKYFLSNPNETLQQIAERFNLHKSTVQEHLTNKELLNVVKSHTQPNLYFFFNSLTERKINTENDGVTIINTSDFAHKEKIFMKSFGFKIDN